jgi:plastocyanin
VLNAPAGAKKFKSKTQVHGTYSHLFTVKGKFTLLCTIHGLTMIVNVT